MSSRVLDRGHRSLIAAIVAMSLFMEAKDVGAQKTPPMRPKAGALELVSETNAFTLGRPSHIRLVPDGTAALYLRSGPKDRIASLWELELSTRRERLLLSADQLLGGKQEQLSKEEKAARERKRISTAGFTSFELAQSGERVILKLAGKIWSLERKTGKVTELPLPPGNLLDPRIAPTGERVAFVRDFDLWVAELGAQPSTLPLTTGGSELVQHGLAEFVAMEEMARFAGFWWAPDGRSLVYQTTDHTGVERFTLADASRPEKAAHTFAYPRAGRANADVKLSIVSIDAKKRVDVSWDRERFPYVARVSWQRNAPLTILVQARDQRSEQLLSVEPETGRTALLHTEEDAAWLNLSTTTPRWFADGLSYLWTTERRGGLELERHWPSTNRREVVVAKEHGFVNLVHLDEAQRAVWFSGGPSPVELHLYRAPLDGSTPPVRISPLGGEHEATFSGDGRSFVLTRATPTQMARSTVHAAGTREVVLDGATELPSVAIEPESRPNLELVPPERAGGLHAMIIRPNGFDPKKRYPVVTLVYGGPGFNIVHSTMTSYFIPQWVADHGFVVVCMDGRGTPRRGRDHERALQGKFGSVPLDDQITGLTALARNYPELDLSRVGVYGWSFGGYMAALSVLKRPDVYKVAVSGAPVVDWEYYDTHYTERYLGLPQHAREDYRAANLLTYASKLERPLLLVHGIADDNVYFAHTLQLADALFRAKRPFELLPLVGLTHQVADPAIREALYTRIVDFLGAELW
ncbi:S9 family peptidase [Myxococcota bacterium]|nr:S9 family peptidase [Myxococcota bacterium]